MFSVTYIDPVTGKKVKMTGLSFSQRLRITLSLIEKGIKIVED